MKKFFAILFIWGLVLGGAGSAYWFLFREPDQVADNDKDKDRGKDKDKVPDKVPAGFTPIKLALDSFSGYCIFRSEDMKKKLAEKKLYPNWVDDGADYAKRMETIKKGDTPYAVFTIDALINQTPNTGNPPATIVMLLDETRGADAMVAYETGVGTIDALNSPRAKVVLVPDSPSETLLRIVRSRFNLPEFPKQRKEYLVEAKDAEDAYTRLLNGKATDKTAYVLWEPYVSLALQQPGVKRLVDSSRFKGMIVDVLVVQTDYLQQHRDEVKSVVQAYLDVLHRAQSASDGMARMVKLDAEIIKEPKVGANAEAVVRGIWWKNTMENYAHFGLLPPVQQVGYLQLDEMIKNITAVLEQTKQDGDKDPKLARPDKLADAGVLQQLYDQKPRAFNSDELLRPEESVPTNVDWTKLKEVGSLKMPELKFTTSGKPNEDAEGVLAELALNLKQWPKYYLRIEGNTEKIGDLEANRNLAKRRANGVLKYLTEEQKIPEARLTARGNEPGGGKNVRFVFLEEP